MAVENNATSTGVAPLANFTDKDVIINAWFLVPDISPATLTDAIPSLSYENARNVLNDQIRGQKISDDDLRAAANRSIQMMVQGALSDQFNDLELTFEPHARYPFSDVLPQKRGAKKTILINLWLLNPDVESKAAATIADCHIVYVYKIFGQLRNGKLIDEAQEKYNPELIGAIIDEVFPDYDDSSLTGQ